MEIVKSEPHESELQRINRAFKMLVECNRMIIRAKMETEILNEICQLIVKVGNYRLAWIGLAMQDSAKRVYPLAQAGFGDGYLESINITWSDTKFGQGPTGNAIRTGSTMIVNDIMGDPQYEPWRAEASRRGYASSVALPFSANGQVQGALNIYAKEPNAFDQLEVQLLEMLSDNLAYGLHSLRAHSEFRKSVKALRVSEERYRGIFENTKNGVVVLKAVDDGKDFNFVKINKAAEKIENINKAKIIGKSISEIFPEAKKFGLFDILQRVWVTGKPEHLPAAFYRDNRISGWREHFVYKLPSGEIVSVYRDETERKKAEAALRESGERYRILTENVADGVMLIQNEKLLFVNRALCLMFDCQDPNQLIGTEAISLIDNEHKQAFKDMYSAFMEGNLKEKKLQTRCISKEGKNFWVEGYYNFLFWKEKPAVLATARDISEVKLSEINMEKAAENLRNENLKLQATLKDRYKFGEIVGKSSSMREVYGLILQAAASDTNVIIYGETGTGKELIARTIHEMSDRHEQAFVPVNCGAIPETIFESEFFGHRKGAFTGAYADSPGFFDLAHEGTLFLDEVGELTLNMQAKLLRAIEGGGYTPIGGNSIRQVDVRIISATNRKMAEEVKKGMIREDFFYRIHVIPIVVPPLKERKEDIPLLVEHLMKSYTVGKERKKISKKIMAAFQDYDWSGNVRELQNVLQRFLAVDNVEIKGPSDLDFLGPVGVRNDKMDNFNESPDGKILDFRTAVQKFEKNLIISALEKNQWHKAKAAAMLNLPRRTFFRKLSDYELI